MSTSNPAPTTTPGARPPGWYPYPDESSASVRCWNGRQWVGALARGEGASDHHHVGLLYVFWMLVPLGLSLLVLVRDAGACSNHWAIPAFWILCGLSVAGAATLGVVFADLREHRGTNWEGTRALGWLVASVLLLIGGALVGWSYTFMASVFCSSG